MAWAATALGGQGSHSASAHHSCGYSQAGGRVPWRGRRPSPPPALRHRGADRAPAWAPTGAPAWAADRVPEGWQTTMTVKNRTATLVHGGPRFAPTTGTGRTLTFGDDPERATSCRRSRRSSPPSRRARRWMSSRSSRRSARPSTRTGSTSGRPARRVPAGLHPDRRHPHRRGHGRARGGRSAARSSCRRRSTARSTRCSRPARPRSTTTFRMRCTGAEPPGGVGRGDRDGPGRGGPTSFAEGRPMPLHDYARLMYSHAVMAALRPTAPNSTPSPVRDHACASTRRAGERGDRAFDRDRDGPPAGCRGQPDPGRDHRGDRLRRRRADPAPRSPSRGRDRRAARAATATTCRSARATPTSAATGLTVDASLPPRRRRLPGPAPRRRRPTSSPALAAERAPRSSTSGPTSGSRTPADYPRWYGFEHPRPDLLSTAPSTACPSSTGPSSSALRRRAARRSSARPAATRRPRSSRSRRSRAPA